MRSLGPKPTGPQFKDWGWVELASDPAWAWRGGEYTITGNGRAVAERGETRK